MQADEVVETAETTAEFFALKNHKDIIERAYFRLKDSFNNIGVVSTPKKRFSNKFMNVFLGALISVPDIFDSYCKFNIDAIGEQLLRRLKVLDFVHGKEIENDEIISLAYRFLVELKLARPQAISSEIESCMAEIPHHVFAETSMSQFVYAEHQMLIGVISSYLHHADMIDLKKLPSVIKESEKVRQLSEEFLKEKEKRVKALGEVLTKYETAFNFVGLYNGFKMLRHQKIIEGRLGLAWLSLLGLLMLAPFAGKFYILIALQDSVKLDLYSLASVVGFELILGYFFRVGLHGYRAVKAQLIQIDLRMALCQFIQNYVEYAKDVRKESPELLDKFDQLIFSGIVNNEGAIPSTFDGLEHVANVLDKLKPRG